MALLGIGACSKSDRSDAGTKPPALETAAADFKARVGVLKTTKIENAVFADVSHDVVRTNSITSPLKAEVSAKRIIKKDDGTYTIYDLKVFAEYRDNAWQYERYTGKMIDDGTEFEIHGDATKLHSAYDIVKALRLKHEDIGFEQFN